MLSSHPKDGKKAAFSMLPLSAGLYRVGGQARDLTLRSALPRRRKPDMKAEDLITVRQLAAEIPGFTEGGLRYRIFHAEKLGLSGAVLRVGRKVLIDRAAFLRWLQDAGKTRATVLPETSAALRIRSDQDGSVVEADGGDL